MQIKLWHIDSITLGLVVAIYIARGRRRIETSAQKETGVKREAVYQATLRIYSQDLKPGMTRREVEGVLRARGVDFTRMCCVEERSAFADLVKIGQEEHPWYCSENDISVAFEFVATKPRELDSIRRWSRDDSDVLKSISLFRQLGGCL